METTATFYLSNMHLNVYLSPLKELAWYPMPASLAPEFEEHAHEQPYSTSSTGTAEAHVQPLLHHFFLVPPIQIL